MGIGPNSAQPLDGSILIRKGGVWIPSLELGLALQGLGKAAGQVDLDGSLHLQAQNTAATSIPRLGITLAAHLGLVVDFVISRGAGRVRTGTLHLAGDAAAPSLTEAATSVGSLGITWSAIAAGGVNQIQLAVDNAVAVPVRLRWSARKLKVP